MAMALLQTFTVRNYVKGLEQHAQKPLFQVAQTVSDQSESESTKQKLQSTLASLENSGSSRPIDDAIQVLLTLDSQKSLASPKDSEQAALEQTIFNKVAIAVYSQALDILLAQSLEAEKEMEWWDNIERSPLNVAHYFLQTLPSRLLGLIHTFRDGLRRRNMSMNIHQLSPSSLRLLFPSRALRPSVLVTSLFPHLRHSSPSSFPSFSLFFDPQSTARDCHFREITHIFSHFARSVRSIIRLPYQLTTEECGFKRRQLETIRNDRASALGQLAQERLRLRDTLQRGQCDAESLRPTMEVIDQIMGGESSVGTSSTLSMLQAFSTITLAEYKNLHAARLQSKQLLRPSRLTRLWPRLVLGPPIFLYAASRLYHSRGTLLQLARDSKEVLHGFLVDWLIEPLKGVLDTVRSKDKGVIVSKEGVDADFESLERMAISLAKDHLNYNSDQLHELSQQVKSGDLTPVMRLYEEDIRSPLKSALTGTLLRTLFIQVQKAKVDIDQALAGIDRLLKSQELTFAFVGVAPAFSILYLTVGYVQRLWVGGRGQGRYGGKHQRGRVLFAMRRIERLLIHDQCTQVTSLTAGLLMVSVAQLQSYAERYLPDRSKLKEGFLEDVEDLEDPELGGRERRLVVERMWRSWGKTLGLGEIAGEGITI
ncbi:NCA2-domain-containing protein [Marasmius fiardii PR-910]|nr:NCA2-domain-containing protein [Marasmius fiardii PR-910]